MTFLSANTFKPLFLQNTQFAEYELTTNLFLYFFFEFTIKILIAGLIYTDIVINANKFN